MHFEQLSLLACIHPSKLSAQMYCSSPPEFFFVIASILLCLVIPWAPSSMFCFLACVSVAWRVVACWGQVLGLEFLLLFCFSPGLCPWEVWDLS